MRITFRINYKTEWGQQMWLSGSNKTTGNWNKDKAIAMTYIGEGDWETNIELEKPLPFEYKYCLASGNNLQWEGGKNRIFVPEKGYAITIRDHWQLQHDEQSVLDSRIFDKVYFRRTKKKKAESIVTGKNIIRFSVNAPRLKPNQTLGITGNNKMLGLWGKPLLLDDTEFPVWKIDIELNPKAVHFPIEYKYVITNSKTGKIDLWEEGSERQLLHVDTESPKNLYIQNDDRFKHPQAYWKGAGVAVPVFSLRTENSFGVGEFSDLMKLSDWAKLTGLKMIQVLPINETVATHSWLDSYPYKAISVFALHPMFLNLEKLGKLNDEKLMDEFEIARELLNSKHEVDYVQVTQLKSRYYKLIFDQTWDDVKESRSYKQFFKTNKDWLEDYAAFCFLRDRFKTGNFRKWSDWAEYKPEKIKQLTSPDSGHFEHIAVHYFIQYHLDKQLQEAIDYGHKAGIAFKGDIPIGISPDSIEAWTKPTLFNLNGQAGAPPDDFAILGQNWGFPTYNWEIMSKDGFTWWRKRLEALSQYFDAYRIDHILGFFRIWEIPQHAIHGLLGYFRPGLPLSPDEIRDRGIDFETDRFTKPYIKDHFLNEIFGNYVDEVKKDFLIATGNGSYKVKEEFDTQKKIHRHFTPNEEEEHHLPDRDLVIRDGLISLLDEVLFIRDPYSPFKAYHPRISMHYSHSFRELDHETKNNLEELYIDFFYRRHENFWKNEAYNKLPTLIKASNMLVCGEDLGMVPDCVTEVMKNLNILSLEIQRMPKNPEIEFGNPHLAPYLSVCTTSTHDMSTIRGWWEENREKTQRFYHHLLGHNNPAPYYAEPWICKDIIQHHLLSPAMLTIFPIQDLISIDGNLRWSETDKERINVPSDTKNKWKYRMILSLEELLKADEFNQALKSMIKKSGRCGDV
jgi:4-alpha-glucanotransferase